MVEGLSKGSGLALLAVPMVEAFTFNQAQFRRILIKHLGLAEDVALPWTHHCGNGVARTLTASTVNHLEVCPVLGRNSAAHNAVRDALAHLVKFCGLADAAVVESPVQAADGDTTVADVVYVDRASGQRRSRLCCHCGFGCSAGGQRESWVRGNDCAAASARRGETQSRRHPEAA